MSHDVKKQEPVSCECNLFKERRLPRLHHRKWDCPLKASSWYQLWGISNFELIGPHGLPFEDDRVKRLATAV